MGNSRLGLGYNYPTEKYYDEAKQLIKKPVSSYGPRGLDPYYYLDDDGTILETDYLQKVYLYKEKQSLSEQTDRAKILELIDERLTDLTFQAKEYLATTFTLVSNENEKNAIIESLATIVSLIGTSQGVSISPAGIKGIINLMIPKGNYGVEKERYTRKLNLLEKEANYLQISKKRLTGFYESQNPKTLEDSTIDSLGNNTTAPQSAKNTDTFLIVAIVVAVVLFLRKKLKKRK